MGWDGQQHPHSPISNKYADFPVLFMYLTSRLPACLYEGPLCRLLPHRIAPVEDSSRITDSLEVHKEGGVGESGCAWDIQEHRDARWHEEVRRIECL